MVGPASARTAGGEAARGNDFVLVDDDGRGEMATAWVNSLAADFKPPSRDSA